MKKALRHLRVALPALLLLACSNPPESSPEETEISVDETLTRPVEVRAGDTVKVTLDVQMSSGSSWRLSGDTPAPLKLLGNEVLPIPNQNYPRGMVGMHELQVFRFKAVSKGEMTLEFVKARPWDKGKAPEKTFHLQLSVVAK